MGAFGWEASNCSFFLTGSMGKQEASSSGEKAEGKRQKLFVFCSIDDRHENRD
jgi:hypothetical protein